MVTMNEKYKSIFKKDKMAERRNWVTKNRGMQGAG
jgi:hypothetical protein